MTVRIPQQIASGTYYITAWADAYDAVLEDSLASNVNPDDPTTLDSSNFKARAIDIIGSPTALPDLQVTAAATDATTATPASGDRPLTVTWTVTNAGDATASGTGGTWADSVYLHDLPDVHDPQAKVWFLGTFDRVGSLDPGASYTQTKTFALSPATKGLYVTVVVDANPFASTVPESNESNNSLTVATAVVDEPANLVVTSVGVPAHNFSGEKTTVTWTVRNDGGSVWSGTRLWADTVWVSPDPVFGGRAQSLGSLVHSATGGFAHGASYDASLDVTLPAGFDGPYFVYVVTDPTDEGKPSPFAGATEVQRGNNGQTVTYYGTRVYEGSADTDNVLRATIDVTYREPDLKITCYLGAARAGALGPERHRRADRLERRHA